MSTDFTATRALFDLPPGITYLDGNSLGPLPRAVPVRIASVLSAEWGEMAIGGWNRAGWIDMPRVLGDRIAPLIGAPEGSVVIGDTLSIKVYQALSAALDLVPDRKVILSDSSNFPTDLYMAEGLIRERGAGHELRVVAPEEVAHSLSEETAVLMLTEVDYRTGRLHDMAALTAAARDLGIVTVWDLAHSAGALPVDVRAAGADFAVGCTYKYLNAGPGAPAFIYAASRHIDTLRPALSGWFGHAAPFDFEPGYRPAPGIERLRVGTPPVLQMAALDTALDIWEGVSLQDVRRRSCELSERLIAAVEAECPDLVFASPRDSARRGSQVSFRHSEGYAIMQALIAQGVVGDFRAPDILRFGVTPLYLGPDDIDRAASVLARTMAQRLWDDPAYQTRTAVT